MIYFISGHEDLTLSEFNIYYFKKLKNIINNDMHARFVIGDNKGVDKMSVNLLLELGVRPYKITIYTTSPTSEDCRLYDEDLTSDCKFYVGFESEEDADTTMTKDSDLDVAFIREGKENSSTAMNIMRRYLMI